MLKIATIYDTKSEIFFEPHFFKTRGQALRTLTDLVNDPDTIIGKHPQDFVLFELGSFDEFTGKFDLHPAPISLGLAIEYRNGKELISDTNGSFNMNSN